jgi:hypothetical protein
MGLPPTDAAMPMEITRGLRLPDDAARVADAFRDVLARNADTFEVEYMRVQRGPAR